MARRPDESMDLLRTLTQGAQEPEYATTTAPRRTAWVSVVVFGLIAVLLSYAVAQTFRGRDVQEAQTRALLAEIADARAHQSELSDHIGGLEQEINELQLLQVQDPRQRAEIEQAGLLSGATAVHGPGIVVTVADAATATASEGRVLDTDLTILVNGLFEAGAEAVAINGRRITARSPIRTAGAAITVDYVSLNSPYKVEAIGDPKRLQGRFGGTRAASWWQYLKLNYGLTLEIAQPDDDLTLAADPGLVLRHAKGD